MRLRKQLHVNLDAVEELVQSQEDRPQSHLSTRQISRELGISRIVHDELSLKRLKRRTCARTDGTANQDFFSVASPSNTQNGRLTWLVLQREKGKYILNEATVAHARNL